MAKKIIFATSYECKRAHETLMSNKIEHVLVTYKHKEVEQIFIVVRNVILKDVKPLGFQISRIKSVRHYDATAIKHDYYEPQFTCECRNCGKEFKHRVKEAVWCSEKCHKEFRNKKKQ